LGSCDRNDPLVKFSRRLRFLSPFLQDIWRGSPLLAGHRFPCPYFPPVGDPYLSKGPIYWYYQFCCSNSQLFFLRAFCLFPGLVPRYRDSFTPRGVPPILEHPSPFSHFRFCFRSAVFFFPPSTLPKTPASLQLRCPLSPCPPAASAVFPPMGRLNICLDLYDAFAFAMNLVFFVSFSSSCEGFFGLIVFLRSPCVSRLGVLVTRTGVPEVFVKPDFVFFSFFLGANPYYGYQEPRFNPFLSQSAGIYSDHYGVRCQRFDAVLPIGQPATVRRFPFYVHYRLLHWL